MLTVQYRRACMAGRVQGRRNQMFRFGVSCVVDAVPIDCYLVQGRRNQMFRFGVSCVVDAVPIDCYLVQGRRNQMFRFGVSCVVDPYQSIAIWYRVVESKSPILSFLCCRCRTDLHVLVGKVSSQTNVYVLDP